MANTLMVIEPYWYMDTWVFDDESAGLDKEPFVQGVPEMIDDLVKDIANARSGFRLLFSSLPFSSYQTELTRVKEEYGGYWYRLKNKSAEGWLCPALFRYFDTAPETIYVKAEPKSGKDESNEVAALKDKIEKLEQLVGKLTLENEFFKKRGES
ncbi:MAG: DUF6717 family protein [Candidatus Thorarchaeota archaeon]